MKRNNRRYYQFTMLLITILLLCGVCSGCAKEEDTKKRIAKGRYVEEDIHFPAGVVLKDETILGLLKSPDEEIELYTVTNWDVRLMDSTPKYYRYTLKNNKEWKSTKLDWGNQTLARFNQYSIMKNISYGADGRLYGELWEYGEGSPYESQEVSDITVRYLVLSEDEWLELKIPHTERYSPQHQQEAFGITATADGDLLIQNARNMEVEVYDRRSGDIRAEIKNPSNRRPIVGDWGVAVLTEEYRGVNIYNPTNGRLTASYNFSDYPVDVNSFCGEMLKNSIAITTRDGIFTLPREGFLWEMVVDPSITAASMPSMTVNHMFEGKENDFFVFYSNTEIEAAEPFQFMRYRYDDSLAMVPETTLSIYGLQENKLIQQAINKFREVHPEVNVTYQVVLEGNDYQWQEQGQVSQYVSELATEAKTNESIDLILCDSMPVNKLIDAGILEECHSVIESVKTEDYFNNILRTYVKKDGCYAVPMQFKTYAMVGPKGALYDVKNLRTCNIPALLRLICNGSTANSVGNERISSATLLSFLYPMMGNALMSSKETPTYSDIMEFTDRMFSYVKPGEVQDSASMLQMTPGYYSINQFISGEVTVGATILQSVGDFALLEAANEYLDEKMSQVVPGGIYQPTTVLAISKKSQHKALAKEFMEYMLTDQMQKQSATLETGLPVSKKRLQAIMKQRSQWITNLYDTNSMYMLYQYDAIPTQKRIQYYIDQLDSLAQCNQVDPRAFRVIWEAYGRYDSGKLTKDQVVEKIFKNLSTLNEWKP